jgi:hypothetical protein
MKWATVQTTSPEHSEGIKPEYFEPEAKSLGGGLGMRRFAKGLIFKQSHQLQIRMFFLGLCIIYAISFLPGPLGRITDVAAATAQTQTVPLVAGWNWVSFQVVPANVSLTSFFSSIVNQVQAVKTINQSASRATGSWVGNLTGMSGIAQGMMYKIQVSSACTLSIQGTPVSGSTSIPLVQGVNWVAYLPANPLSPATALQSILPSVQQVKSQTQSAVPNGNGGLKGDLSQMTAGQGYIILTDASGALVYPTPVTPDVTITIDPATTHTISPWIYGGNWVESWQNAPRNMTLGRMGGNRWTAYNWENNYSNAGSDWYYSNDNYLSNSTTPAEAVRAGIAEDQSQGRGSMMTIQLQGYVSADGSGNVDMGLSLATRLATRFKPVVFKKGSAFTLTPSPSDGSVYMDEFLWALNQKVPGNIFSAGATLPTFVELDNEPELWPSTHEEIQGTTAITSTNYIARTINLSKALKDQFPDLQLFGPVHYGFNGIYNWQNESGAGFSGSYWFTDKYLQQMKTASDSYGRRLLDAYDIHWYSEAQGDGTRITNLTGSSLTADQIQAVVQSPRSLWDTTYTENSWITQYVTGGPIYLLKRIQDKIDVDYPGTKMVMTEYLNGGDNHIAGAIAQADNLGVFGSMGVYAATLWPMSDNAPFIFAGFKMYRDFDGNLGSFGDISLKTTSSDTSKVAAYVSRDSQVSGRSVIVAINRSTASQNVAFNGMSLSGTARMYRISGAQTTPVSVGQEAVSGTSWAVALPALSVTTMEIR